MNIFNKLELSGQKYYTNENLIDEHYKEKLLFSMRYSVSFGTDCFSTRFMSTRFLKDKIYGVRVTQFQLAYICNTTHPSQKNWLSCVVKYIICRWEINSCNYRSGRAA